MDAIEYLESHPSRVRGLKHRDISYFSINGTVAPFTGAWIETTLVCKLVTAINLSHPSRVRGLKHSLREAADELLGVAPFTGAWIETNHQ